MIVRAIAMTTTHENSAAVPVTRGNRTMSTVAIPAMTRVGQIGTVSRLNARSIRASRSPATWTCRVGWSGRSYEIATVSTRCAARRRARLRRSARFEWSPVVISEITTIVQPIRAQATCDTSASKD